MAVAAVSGLLSIKLVKYIVSSDKFGIFAWYTLILGVLVLALFIARFFIRLHYRKVMEERRRKRLAAKKRRAAALRQQQARQRRAAAAAANSVTYGNVTYWPGTQPPQDLPPSASAGSGK